jgi:phage/plasmid-like protein (TIGR03299 family)
MAHLVETMMYAGETPWHGLGKKIPEGKTLGVQEALTAAGLDWKVDLRRLYTVDGHTLLNVLGRYAVCRQKDNAILGIVGQDYTPLQNEEAFAWFQPFLDSADVTLETAGSLKGGSQVWVLAKIQGANMSVGDNDEVAYYVLLSNSHDGSLPVCVGFTPIRVVCNNTLCLAHESEASKLLRVRHTARLLKNLDDIREIMDIAHKEFYATIEQYRTLMKRAINHHDFVKYVKLVFNLSEKGGKELIPNIAYLVDHGRGSELAGQTYWGAYNAVTEYLNYFRGKTQDNTLNSLWYGDSAEVNKRALDVALEMAA